MWLVVQTGAGFIVPSSLPVVGCSSFASDPHPPISKERNIHFLLHCCHSSSSTLSLLFTHLIPFASLPCRPPQIVPIRCHCSCREPVVSPLDNISHHPPLSLANTTIIITTFFSFLLSHLITAPSGAPHHIWAYSVRGLYSPLPRRRHTQSVPLSGGNVFRVGSLVDVEYHCPRYYAFSHR